MAALRLPTEPAARGLALLGAIAAAALVSALLLQYVAGLEPCHLCILERFPYLGVVLVAVLGLWLGRPRPALAIVALLLALDAGLAAYHVGVEQGVFSLPESCAAVGQAATLEDLRAQLAAAPARCDQVPLRVLGLSLAGWNGVLAACLALLSLALLVVTGRRPAVSS